MFTGVVTSGASISTFVAFMTIQAQILDLLLDYAKEERHGAHLITHSMVVVAETAERVNAQYTGQQVEMQPASSLFDTPGDPYTTALRDALPERARSKRLPTIPRFVPGAADRLSLSSSLPIRGRPTHLGRTRLRQCRCLSCPMSLSTRRCQTAAKTDGGFRMITSDKTSAPPVMSAEGPSRYPEISHGWCNGESTLLVQLHQDCRGDTVQAAKSFFVTSNFHALKRRSSRQCRYPTLYSTGESIKSNLSNKDVRASTPLQSANSTQGNSPNYFPPPRAPAELHHNIMRDDENNLDRDIVELEAKLSKYQPQELGSGCHWLELVGFRNCELEAERLFSLHKKIQQQCLQS